MSLREQTLRYVDAATYARQRLGDLSASQYQELRSLAQTSSRIELHDLIDAWATKGAPDPLADTWRTIKTQLPEPEPQVEAPVPAPTLEQLPPPPVPPLMRTSECRHFGGNWFCWQCKRENAEAKVVLAGVMHLAQEMFEKHRAFVRDRMHTELTPYTNGESYPLFDDLEQQIWAGVTARIARYEDRSQPLAWLKTVVHSVVTDHFKRVWAKKRGAAVTEPLVGDVPDYLPAQPTRPPGAAPDTEK